MLKSDITKPDKNIPYTPKIAIFYDWLNQWGGAERLLLDIIHIYPQAQIFTSIYNPQKTTWLKIKHIHSTWLDRLNFLNKSNPLIGILSPIAIESFDFSNFDLVISITSQSGFCLITPPSTCHICYCLNPNRHLYQQTYPSICNQLVKKIKNIQTTLAQRPDYFLTISQTVQSRIKRNLNRQSTIVYPGVNTNLFKPAGKPTISDYFLVVSRLVKHKRVDLAVKACHSLGQKLIIIGNGPYFNKLSNLYPHDPNIKFLGQVDDKKLVNLYQNCQALICPQVEDFGLTAIEAQACGRPVIAYGKGSFRETIINNLTGILFYQPTSQNLKKAIIKFKQNVFSQQKCRQQALKFSQSKFMLEFKHQINQLWFNYQNSLHQNTLS